MIALRLSVLALSATTLIAAEPRLAGIGAAMEQQIAKHEIAGAVTMVVAATRFGVPEYAAPGTARLTPR